MRFVTRVIRGARIRWETEKLGMPGMSNTATKKTETEDLSTMHIYLVMYLKSTWGKRYCMIPAINSAETLTKSESIHVTQNENHIDGFETIDYV